MYRPDTLALTGLLAFLSAVGPISTDIFLPSLPVMRAAFDTDLSRVQLTLSIFTFGFALGQIAFGPLSDRLGRKPVLTVTLIVYLLGSFVCVFAPDIRVMLAGRLLQAIGAAGPIVLARSMVRDLYEGRRAAQELGRMGLITGIVPSLAPLLGGVLEMVAGWRASFAAMAIFGALALVGTQLRLPETLRRRLAEPFTFAAVFGGFGLMLKNRAFVVAMISMALGFAGIFAFISGSSFVLQETYGLGEIAYGVSFGAGAAMLWTGNLVSQWAVPRYGVTRVLAVASLFTLVGGLAMVVAVEALPGLVGRPTALAVVVPYMVFMLGVGPVLPLSTLQALQPFPDRAGTAASLLGCVQLSFGALVGFGVGLWLEVLPDAVPLALTIALAGSGVAVAQWYGRRPA